ncbi:MAG: hypothetical protein CM15mP121_2430 [Bacteroidota bacterium]|nr:MAG: hypothetical protein CM15mP121_2430 [Bacteroidota bacterium]
MHQLKWILFFPKSWTLHSNDMAHYKGSWFWGKARSKSGKVYVVPRYYPAGNILGKTPLLV